MPIVDKQDDRVIRLITQEAEKFQAKIKKIDLEKQILDIDCPDENKAECAVAIQKILDQHK
jgi:c-di-GMP-binding flagellar brake protein YcgR